MFHRRAVLVVTCLWGACAPPVQDGPSVAAVDTPVVDTPVVDTPDVPDDDTPTPDESLPDTDAPTPDPAAGLTPPAPGGGTPSCELPQLTTYTWPNIPVGIGYFERQTGTVSTTASWPNGTTAVVTITFNVTQDPVLSYTRAPLPGMNPLSCPPHVHIPVHVAWDVAGWASGEYFRYIDIGDGREREEYADEIPIELWDTMPGVAPADRPLVLNIYGEWRPDGRFVGHVTGNLREDQYLPGENQSMDYMFWDTIVP